MLLLLLLLGCSCCCGTNIIIAIVAILLTQFLQEGADVPIFNFVLTIFKKDTVAQGVTYTINHTETFNLYVNLLNEIRRSSLSFDFAICQVELGSKPTILFLVSNFSIYFAVYCSSTLKY